MFRKILSFDTGEKTSQLFSCCGLFRKKVDKHKTPKNNKNLKYEEVKKEESTDKNGKT